VLTHSKEDFKTNRRPTNQSSFHVTGHIALRDSNHIPTEQKHSDTAM